MYNLIHHDGSGVYHEDAQDKDCWGLKIREETGSLGFYLKMAIKMVRVGIFWMYVSFSNSGHIV